ncbi:hypothetical protein [Dermatobacter hominis]|uniref:hypothetical protein n=1 Tax=Dermatobacter hominis TaxID=2884263 RepID=UPI001D105560|nr:hypothetical protein [Dermatobacter hominis]UDY37003.1 hypothetical protein LH044_05560 [Dermatobacter hominis]
MAAGEPAHELTVLRGERPDDAGGQAGADRRDRPDRPDRSDRAGRLARLRELAGELSPVTLAGERRLPVLPALEAVLPDGLRRGSTVAVGGPGSTALLHAVLAGPTRAGSWVACVGAPALGWAAAAELGVALERVAVVRTDERRAPAVLAALVDAFDLVVVGPDHRPDRTEVRRLLSRAKERGAVVLTLHGSAAAGAPPRGGDRTGPWPGADVHLRCGSPAWSGPGDGWGHLQERRVTVTVEGRRSFDRPRRVDLLLPGADGVALADGDATALFGAGAGTEGGAEVVPLVRRQVG